MPSPIGPAESSPDGVYYTYYRLGDDANPWEKLYVREINVVKNNVLGTGGNVYAQGDVIANLGKTNQVSLASLAPVAQTITIPSSNANFSGNLHIATSGNVRTIFAALATKKQITLSMSWLDIYTFSHKPIQAVQCVFPVNNAASPTPTFMTRIDTNGLLNILAQQNIASDSSLRFTLTVILA